MTIPLQRRREFLERVDPVSARQKGGK